MNVRRLSVSISGTQAPRHLNRKASKLSKPRPTKPNANSKGWQDITTASSSTTTVKPESSSDASVPPSSPSSKPKPLGRKMTLVWKSLTGFTRTRARIGKPQRQSVLMNRFEIIVPLPRGRHGDAQFWRKPDSISRRSVISIRPRELAERRLSRR
ncbi:hypothetical protein BD410DRAFT_284454 [Rickenella mellea]|uniref:Uncharacterized protein n=1 Tax=Rickenella mellea TaxID=50990 RepID=A0A4Y7Q3K9_9AGAM|nr:hypothetical protein BD410DRAFT_284454 [Rickenella mellea]